MTIKAVNSSVLMQEASKQKKGRCSLYEAMKGVARAIFGGFLQQPATKPVEQASEDPALRATRLMDRALQSRIITALYKEACNTATRNHASGEAWNVIFESNRFGAVCNTGLRQITIDPEFSDDKALRALIFELVNAVQTPKKYDVQELARQSLLGRHEYGYNVECLEYETECGYREILEAVIQEMGLDEERFPVREERSLQEYLEAVEASGHTEAYRRQWDAIRKEAEQT